MSVNNVSPSSPGSASGRTGAVSIRRLVNDEILKAATPLDDGAGVFEFICECGDLNCQSMVKMTLAEYLATTPGSVAGHSLPQSLPQEARQSKDQAVFRSVNDRIVELAETFSVEEQIEIICECANSGCIERIEVPVGEYTRVRGCPEWYLVTPGHIFAGDEHVVEHRPGYDIVKV